MIGERPRDRIRGWISDTAMLQGARNAKRLVGPPLQEPQARI